MAYRRTKPVFVWIAAIPILLLAASAWRRSQYRELIRMVDHTREVQAEIQDLLVSLMDAETGRRGFIATGDANYLAIVEGSGAKTSARIQQLATLTQDNPAQQLNVQQLERLVKERIELLRQTSQVGGSDAAIQAEKRNGLAASKELSAVMAQMMAEETQLLNVRKQATARADSEGYAFFIAGSGATILLLIWAYRIVRQYAAGRDKAEFALHEANHQLQDKVVQLDRLNHELEDRVKARTADLERSNQDLQQFAFVASHDLQEPLRMVVSYLGLLAKTCQDQLNAEAEKYLGFAVQGSTRMQMLIRDLLAYAQVSSQALMLKRTRLEDVVGQARYGVLASIRETQAEITTGTLPEVEVDPLKMSLVFQNLLSNAIKFRQPDGKPRIQIEAKNEGGEWLVSVRDGGIGFDPKYADKIFGAFQRLHGKGQYPGTGIGLAICKRIVEGHGGRIWADAQPGSGAVFYFTLPALAESTPSGDETVSPRFHFERGA